MFALASGGVLLGERLDTPQWLAVVLVMMSVVLVSQRQRLWEPWLSATVSPSGDLNA